MTDDSHGIILIGLDGATWNLLRPWVNRGKLQIFRELIRKGSSGILRSTVPCETLPAMPSLYTGKNPGNTGIFGFLKPDGSRVKTEDIKDSTIWDVLDAEGFKSCLVNLMWVYPPRELNGIVVSGGLTTVPGVRDYFFPKDLEERVKGFYDWELEKRHWQLVEKPKENEKESLELALHLVRNKCDVFKKLMLEGDFDFSMFWISMTDKMQHYYWYNKDLLLKLYMGVEKMLQEIVAIFQDKNLIVVSDHGFERSPDYYFCVNKWLEKQGYLKRGNKLTEYLVERGIPFAKKYISSITLARVLRFYEKLKKAEEKQESVLSKYDFLPGINWKKTVAFLSTRWGIDVKKEMADLSYEEVVQEIMSKLKELRGPDGKPVIRKVWRKEKIFSGKYIKQIPDIVFLTNGRYLAHYAFTKDIFIPFICEEEYNSLHPKGGRLHTGYHYVAREGVIIAYGPDIKSKFRVDEAEIIDIAPTILHLLGCKIPWDMDGKVLSKIFDDDSDPAKREVRYRKPLETGYRAVERKLTKEEEEKEEEIIKKRLRALGYIE